MFEIVDETELFKRHPNLNKLQLAHFLNDCFKMVKKDLLSKKLADVYSSDDYPNVEIHLNDINNGMLFALYRNGLIGAISYSKGNIKDDFGLKNDQEYDDFMTKINVDKTNYCTLHRLFVIPEYQGQGVGKALIKEAESRFKNTTILFLVSPFNIPAINMYEKLDYQNLGSYPFAFGNFVVFKKEN